MSTLRPAPRARVTRVLLAAATLLGAACTAERLAPPPGLLTSAYVAQVATADGAVLATYVDSAAPVDGGADVFTGELPGLVIVGGSSPVTFARAEPFQTVIVTIGRATGYYRLDLPAPVTEVQTVISWSQEMPRLQFTARTASAGGRYKDKAIRALRVGTGDVQVSVAFDAPTDVDLHVYDPSGEEIFFANREAASGGKLDLDANAGCSIDNPIINNENITWARGTAPRGTYRVVLDYWSSCNQPRTNWVVTVHRRGQPLQTFSGAFIDPASPDVEVTTFTY